MLGSFKVILLNGQINIQTVVFTILCKFVKMYKFKMYFAPHLQCELQKKKLWGKKLLKQLTLLLNYTGCLVDR